MTDMVQDQNPIIMRLNV